MTQQLTRAHHHVYQTVQNGLYRFLHRRFGDDVVFMNWAYETDPPMRVPLDPADEPDRYSIQLYHATAQQSGIAGKRVLEVGCGRGGGASYLAQAFHPASYTGVDLSAAGIDFCRRRHPGLVFDTGNAEDLPYAAESFDAVVNIESSHCYPRFDVFLSEVDRVLTPGGVLLYADLRATTLVDRWDRDISESGLDVERCRDITPDVLRGMELNTSRWDSITSGFPRFAQRTVRKGVPAKGSVLWDSATHGRTVYRMYLMRKPG
jgi:SAM-dependent methyltransferase